jgi:hypothetical protein
MLKTYINIFYRPAPCDIIIFKVVVILHMCVYIWRGDTVETTTEKADLI